MEDNVEGLGRDLARALRKSYYNRETAENLVDRAVANWKLEGNHLPANMKSGSFRIYTPDAIKTYSEHLEKQTAFDEKIQAELKQLSPTYILGLEKQIERLKPDNDTAAIELIEREINSTKRDPDYFPNLMLDAE